MSAEKQSRARIRAKLLANLLLCVPDAGPRERHEVAIWVEGDCAEDRNLRLLCLELVASHRRTGQMSTARVLVLARELHEFATDSPDNLPRAGPVPRREARSLASA